MTRKEQVAEAVACFDSECGSEEAKVLVELGRDYLAGKIGEMAGEEEIANTILFYLESGPWLLMSTFVNSGDVVDIAKTLVGKIPRRGVEDKCRRCGYVGQDTTQWGGLCYQCYADENNIQ